MERFTFDADASFAPRSEWLERVTIAPLTAPIQAGSPFQAAVFRLAPGGGIARHPADLPQILAVLEGTGEVTGGEGVAEPIGPGEAVFWRHGEEHGLTSSTGATVLILEGEGLEPFRR